MSDEELGTENIVVTTVAVRATPGEETELGEIDIDVHVSTGVDADPKQTLAFAAMSLRKAAHDITRRIRTDDYELVVEGSDE